MSGKTKRILCILPLLICILFVISASFTGTVSEQAALDTIAPESELTITPSKTHVAAFETQNKDFTSTYDMDECYNITPEFIAAHSDFEIFKYEEGCESFVLYDGQVYPIGSSFGGYGITSMALADFNKDGQYELYYTFSWGSGTHRSQLGYFNPANKKETIFDCSIFTSDLILTVNEAGDLCVNSVVPDFYDNTSNVDFTIKAQNSIGYIAPEKNKIAVYIDQSILDQNPSNGGSQILYKIERLLHKLQAIF